MAAKGGGRTNLLLYIYSFTDHLVACGVFHVGKSEASLILSHLADTNQHGK